MQLTNGKTYKQFYNDSKFWNPQAWHEGALLLVNGRDWGDKSIDKIPDDAIVRIAGGIVCCEDLDWELAGLSMDALFAAWLGDDDNKTLLVKAPVDKLDELKQYLLSIGGYLEG